MNERYHPRSEMASAGAALSRAREAQNLSVVEVARHLKLTPAQVESLEAGSYDRLPGRVFVRGFIRNYARLVKIDPEPLLRSIEHDMPQPAVSIPEARMTREVALPVAKRSRWPLFAGIAFLFVAALAVYEFGFNENGREGASAAPDAAPATAGESKAPAAPVAPTAATPPRGSSTAQAPAPIATAPTASASGSDAPVSARDDPPRRGGLVNAETMQSAVTKAPRAGERQLYFRFEDDSWVEIRDRENKVVFSKLNRAGAEERVSAMPPLKLIVGNARKVHLTYDAKPVDLTPHIGVTVARVTIE